jgi:hypothetical protein
MISTLKNGNRKYKLIIQVIEADLHLTEMRDQNTTKLEILNKELGDESEINKKLIQNKKTLELEIEEMQSRKKLAETVLDKDILKDLINKNALLDEELTKMQNLYQLYFDANYLYQRLTTMDPYSLTTFLKALNTQILEKNNKTN